MTPIKPPGGNRAAFPWNRTNTENGLKFGEDSEVRRLIRLQEYRAAAETRKHKSRRRDGFR